EPEELAFHFHQAGDSERAYSNYLRAAEKARLDSAFSEQIRLLNAALELAPDREKPDLLERLAKGYAHVGQHKEATDLYRSLLQQPGLRNADKKRYLIALGVSQIQLGQMDEAEKSLLQGAGFIESKEELREIEENLASLELARGNYREARAHCLRVLEMSGRPNDDPAETTVFNILGVISFYESKYDDAIQNFGKTLQRLMSSGRKDKLIAAHINLGNVFSVQKRFQEARDHWQVALTLCQDVGSLEQEAQICNNLGIAHYSRQEYSEALRCYERSLDLFKRTGNLPGQAYCHTNLGEVYLAESAFEKALSAWGQAQDLYERLQDALGLTETRIQLAQAYLVVGDRTNARTCIDRAAYYIEQRGIESQRGAHYLVSGTCLAHAGEFEQGRKLFQRAVEFFEAAHEERQRCIARLRLGILEAAAGNDAAALSILREVAATAQQKEFNDLGANALFWIGTLKTGSAQTTGEEPLTLYKQAFTLLKDQPVSEITWKICLNLGKLYLQRGLTERGHEYLALAASALHHL
ncbi:MAG: tetratricopeptide repeat protein, partial [Deltaproteobacteria bacterium]|nr:tetratricopeptide repeat protein [Deltaproteobacteria bacterium]